MPIRYKYPPDARIKKRGDFVYLQKNGHKLHTRHLLIVFRDSKTSRSRFGVTITKKVAAQSNRRAVFKRRMRELFRLYRQKFAGPLEIIVIARQNSTECSYAELRKEFLGALKHNGLLEG